MTTEKEINLSAVFEVMWERGKRIFIFTLVCMVLGALASLLIKNRYASTAQLIMIKSKLGENTLKNPPVQMGTFSHMIKRRGVLQEAITQFELDKKPYKMKYIDDLAERVNVYLFTDSALFDIYVEMEDMNLAANIANFLAQKAIEASSQMAAYEKITSASHIEMEVEALNTQLNGFQDVYLNTLVTNIKPVLQKELDTNMTILATLRQEKETIDGGIVQIENQIANYDRLFSATDTDFTKFVITRKSIVNDPLVFEAVREKANINLEEISDLTFLSEDLDGGYATLRLEYTKLKVDLEAQKKLSDYKDQRIKQLVKTVAEQQKAFSTMDVNEMVAKANFDRELEIFGGVDKEMGWVGTTIASERQDLWLFEKAIPDPKKVYPRRSLIVAFIGIMAFLFSFLYFLLRDLYGLVGFSIFEDVKNEESKS